MYKDFDGWNNVKQDIHTNGEPKFYCAREIWWCSLGVNIGFEQEGDGNNGARPILIMKGFSKYVCLVIPLTTSTKINEYHFSLGQVDGKIAFAIISQIRLIDTRRLINRIHIIDKNLFYEIRKAVKNLL